MIDTIPFDKESFADFINAGINESASVECKEKWIGDIKLVKIILGMANSGGGRIILGLKEKEDKTFEPVGLEKPKDSADFGTLISKYIPEWIIPGISLKDFSYTGDVYKGGSLAGKIFQVISVDVDISYLPAVCIKEGSDDKEHIYKGDIYYRGDSTKTEKISYEQLQMLLEDVVEAKVQKVDAPELAEELKKLKALYNAIDTYIPMGGFSALKQSQLLAGLLGKTENKVWPDITYEEFLKDVIENLEKIIRERVLK